MSGRVCERGSHSALTFSLGTIFVCTRTCTALSRLCPNGNAKCISSHNTKHATLALSLSDPLTPFCKNVRDCEHCAGMLFWIYHSIYYVRDRNTMCEPFSTFLFLALSFLWVYDVSFQSCLSTAHTLSSLGTYASIYLCLNKLGWKAETGGFFDWKLLTIISVFYSIAYTRSLVALVLRFYV